MVRSRTPPLRDKELRDVRTRSSPPCRAPRRRPEQPPRLPEGKPVTVEARVPALALDREPKAPARPRKAIRLAVEGFQAPADAALRLHAFLNKPDADEKT